MHYLKKESRIKAQNIAREYITCQVLALLFHCCTSLAIPFFDSQLYHLPWFNNENNDYMKVFTFLSLTHSFITYPGLIMKIMIT